MGRRGEQETRHEEIVMVPRPTDPAPGTEHQSLINLIINTIFV
jgi:hypothetical protein